MTVLGLSPPCHTLLLLQFGMGGAVKCRGVLSSPILIPPPLGGVEEEDEALLPPINSLPFSPGCHSLFSLSPHGCSASGSRGARTCPALAWAEPLVGSQTLRPDPPRAPLSPGEGAQHPPSTPTGTAVIQPCGSGRPVASGPAGKLRLNGTRRSRSSAIPANSFIASNEEDPAGSERRGGGG